MIHAIFVNSIFLHQAEVSGFLKVVALCLTFIVLEYWETLFSKPSDWWPNKRPWNGNISPQSNLDYHLLFSKFDSTSCFELKDWNKSYLLSWSERLKKCSSCLIIIIIIIINNKLKTYIAHASWKNDRVRFTWIEITNKICQFLWARNMQ